MKHALVKLAAVATLSAAPSLSSADYVCGVTPFPGQATLPYRLRVTFSAGTNCSGSLTQLWYCEKGPQPASTTCAYDGLRFDREDLIALFNALTRAADSQQRVTKSTTTCASGSGQCGYSVDFSH